MKCAGGIRLHVKAAPAALRHHRQVMLAVPATWGNVQVSIVDITGTEVYHESNFISGKISTKDFSTGIYTLSITSGEKVIRQKMIKQ